MPNLEHDPQHPSDLLGQPVAEGDIVAWGTTYGQSPALCIARIEKIRFVKKVGYSTRKKCSQSEATDYTLRVRPIKSTGKVTWIDKVSGQARYSHHPDFDPDEVESKLKTVLHVKNIVKLSPDAVA